MKASLFITCLSDIFYPEVGKSLVNVLEKLGVSLDFPEGQSCCGQPAYNSGYREDAEKAAKHMIRVFKDSPNVVTPSGSCAAMVRHYYPMMFANDPVWSGKAQELADKTFEFSEFIVKVLKKTDLGAVYPAKVTYHHSCHMKRGIRVEEEPVQLIKSIKGITFVDLPYKEDCCGFGGTFSVKMPEISEQMVDEKIQHVYETEADILVGSDLGCIMNIGGRLRRKGKPVEVLHTAQLLERGLNHGK
ncbi:(Fe-S)-binding protein [Microaerobacter geothermalis]|uniref:(Fe-S)-binding protein n=1 Tax=Microaerobacter geothermalis TaxID=674972 RepID=UPI001F25EEE1|nr:(Fe-S)-binding protein [Microaerobacter geothermalis]MCF6092880.1 (Fe-S)-binding protein [Microaerobacter geothermalis]